MIIENFLKLACMLWLTMCASCYFFAIKFDNLDFAIYGIICNVVAFVLWMGLMLEIIRKEQKTRS